MKRIITLVLAIVMCVGVFSAFSVFASDSQAGGSEIKYIFKENFNNYDRIPTQAECAGLKVFNGYAASGKVEDGVLSMTCDETDAGFLDLQMWVNSGFKAITEDFTLTMNMKLLGEWTNSASNLWVFRYYKSADGALAMNTHAYFTVVDGKFTMATDDGAVSSDVDIFNNFATIDWSFKKTDGKFTSVTCYVNGEKLGTKTFSGEKLEGIDQFRLFWTKAVGQGLALDSFAFTKGEQSLYGVEIPDTPPVPEIPVAPTVTDDQKVSMKYHYRETFDDLEAVNESNGAAEVKEANGFWLNPGEGKENMHEITDEGTLKWGGAEFIDLHFWQLGNKYKVKEDFVFSVNFKPLQEGISGHFVSQVRTTSTTSFTEPYGMIQFKAGCIYIGDTNYGMLPVNEWTRLEVIFDYDEDKGEFTHFKLMINGTVVATEELDSNAMLVQIKHFRLFRVMKTMNFEIDDMCIVSGTQSLLYAKPYEENETPGADDPTVPENPGNLETGEEGGDANEPQTSDTADTTAPKSTETTEKANDDAAVEEKKGCSSSVTVCTAAMVAIVGFAGAALIRKKED